MMKNIFSAFTDKFQSDWQLFIEHWKAYSLVCLVAIGIAVYLRLKDKTDGSQ